MGFEDPWRNQMDSLGLWLLRDVLGILWPTPARCGESMKLPCDSGWFRGISPGPILPNFKGFFKDSSGFFETIRAIHLFLRILQGFSGHPVKLDSIFQRILRDIGWGENSEGGGDARDSRYDSLMLNRAWAIPFLFDSLSGNKVLIIEATRTICGRVSSLSRRLVIACLGCNTRSRQNQYWRRRHTAIDYSSPFLSHFLSFCLFIRFQLAFGWGRGQPPSRAGKKKKKKKKKKTKKKKKKEEEEEEEEEKGKKKKPLRSRCTLRWQPNSVTTPRRRG